MVYIQCIFNEVSIRLFPYAFMCMCRNFNEIWWYLKTESTECGFTVLGIRLFPYASMHMWETLMNMMILEKTDYTQCGFTALSIWLFPYASTHMKNYVFIKSSRKSVDPCISSPTKLLFKYRGKRQVFISKTQGK